MAPISIRKLFWQLTFFCAVLSISVPLAGAGTPKPGDVLPAFALPAPSAEADRAYLGIKGPQFTLSEVAGRITLLEILGVYCPLCHEQAPLFHALFARLAKRDLKDQVKMLGIAAGATDMEVEMIRKEWKINHPVTSDEKFTVHKLLGEPKTPCTLLIDKNNRVLYAHLGVIKDIDRFYQTIKDLLP
jgi:peroxiredoxin